MKKTYEVTSGNMRETVDAAGPQSAAVAAIQRRNWTSLGMLMLIRESGSTNPDTDCFWDSETACKKAGIELVNS
jgi:hypothetical protein